MTSESVVAKETGALSPVQRAETQSGSRASWILYVLAALALGWVFHDLSWETLRSQLRAMDLWWLLPAVACDVLSYLCQGMRWHYLLRPVGRLSLFRCTQAIYVGLFTNEVLPMRVGEVAAAYLGGFWLERPIAQVLPSMLVGRLLDGVWLALAVGALLIFVPLPPNLAWAGDVFGIAVAFALLVFLAMLLRGSRGIGKTSPDAEGDAHGMIGKIRIQFGHVVTGIQEIRDPKLISWAALFSLGILVFQTLAFWLVMRAYHLPVPALAAACVFLIVHLGTAIPNAPANIGSFQFFTVVGLSLFGVDKATAAGFSAVVFLVLTVPLWIIGFIALSRTGLTLHSIRERLLARS